MLDVTKRESLTAIANRCGTDKGSVAKAGHAYTIVYDGLFQHMRTQPVELLEIGLQMGGPEIPGGAADRDITDAPSLRMWRDYFPFAHITGVDISDFSRFENEWFTFHRVDCGVASDYDKITGAFDIIIDDGSHASHHQQLALAKLFPLLRPGGLYIIEDLNWQPETYERELQFVSLTSATLSDYVRAGYLPPALEGLGGQIGPIALYDEDQLYAMRKAFNREHDLTPAMPSYIDRRTVRGWLRRKTVGVDVKLAVIQKI